MEERNDFFEEQKKANKDKRKAVRPWRGLTFLSLPFVVISIAALIAASTFDNTVAIFFGGTFWELENASEEAQYFTTDFPDWEDNEDYGRFIAEQVEAEGATLLYNEAGVLPLEAGAKVSLLSNSSVNPIYGGTGSGNIDASEATSFKDAMEEQGFTVNETLWDFYEEGPGSIYKREEGGVIAHASQKVSEVPWDRYTDDVKNSIEVYGDAAVVMISRVGGEGVDLDFLSTNYLELDENERNMLSAITTMKRSGKVNKIIVLINSANALQMDFMKDDSFDIDAVLWIGDVGIRGTEAVCKILSGKINPSGSLVDTYVYDNYSAPAMVNNVATKYQGATGDIVPEKASYYMIYQEGIYVGYRYYETRYEDYVMGTGNAGEYDYGSTVAYPFGYGLSYTWFDYSDMNVSYDTEQDRFAVQVTVTNIGNSFAGKETVQIYVQSPYTIYDKQHGVEKASVVLCGFGKTGLLQPGESEMLTIYVDRADLASYDGYGERTYILDSGNYYFAAAKDAHNAVNSILAAKGYTPENTQGRMDNEGETDLVYIWNEEQFDATTYSISDAGAVITNRLDSADLNLYVGSPTEITYLSRNDWEGTFPTEIKQLSLTDMLVEDLQNIQYDPNDYEKLDAPVLNADNGRKLFEMRGLDYDDPAWQPLLDQLSFEEMSRMIADGFHWNMPAESVEAPGTRDENGPQGLTTSLLKTDLDATAFTSEDVMAATFNRDLMYEVGRCIGNDCLHMGVSFLYGTGNNIHRTPYGGRNFEYYSEDGYLSGEICAAEVAGMKEKGVEVLMKHFALNDSEAERIGLGVWLNEQAAREIYLKAFQAPVEDSNANGVMVAYTRFGTTWSGGHYGLITGILRGEWGCDGKIITDNALHEYVNAADFVMAGGSIMDAMLPTQLKQIKQYENDTVIVSAMKEAAHRNLYAVVNSSGMNGVDADTTIRTITPWPIWLCLGLVIGFSTLFGVSVVMWIKKARAFRK